MGGKTKQAQRTKNNAKPSSSGRSAELLSKINLDTGLVIGGGNVLPTLFSTLTALDLDSRLNPEYQICIKKLNKKDPITRTKALQELLELVNKSKVEDVVQALPSWTYYYKILTADTDKKVREMTQACHGAIVSACGRQVAPHLKQLLPPWLQAQYDEHAPAQTYAQKSLNTTFPDKKLPEVLSFCKVEVMAHLVANLIGNAESTLITKTDNSEERELQHCRMVTSSLQGLEYFAKHLPASQGDWLWGEIAALLQSNAFWKYASNTSQPVRAAWYATIGRIIERFKSTFAEKYGTKTMRILLGSAKEQNSLVAAQLWSSLLLFMHNVEGWHKYLDQKELLSKRILDILENGGWGDARYLSNILLPLLAHLPEELLNKGYYEAFFKAIFTGLENKNILRSKSERQFWITSLAECLRYLSVQQNDYVVEVATCVHRTWLEKISENNETQVKSNLIKCSATNMASLVKYWLKQSKESSSEQYDQLVRNFWQNIASTISTQIDKVTIDNGEITKLVDGHIILIQTLKSSFLQDTKKQHSIKFDDDSKVDEKVSILNEQCDVSIISRYKHNLDLLVESTSSRYFEFMNSKQVCSAVLMPLFSLLVEFDSEDLFSAIARQFNIDSVYKLYDNVLRNWLSGDTTRCKVLVDVVFLLLKYMNDDEQRATFDSFQQFPPSVVEWCISLSICHPHSSNPAVRAWMRGNVVEASLVQICKRLVAEGDCSKKNLLMMCLSQDEQGELIISVSAVSSIVELFSNAITNPSLPTLEQCVGTASWLATTLLQQHHGQEYTKLVINLFHLNVMVPRGDSRLSVDTWCEVRSSWQDGMAALDQKGRELFMEKAAKIIHDSTFLDKNNLNVTYIEHILSLCPYILNRDGVSDENIIDYISFTKRLFDFKSESEIIETCALRHDCVSCNLNCPFDESRVETECQELDKMNFITYANKVLFRALYLRIMLLHRNEDEEHLSDTLLSNEYFEMEFCKVTYDYQVVCSLHEGYAFWADFTLIDETKQKLTTVLLDILNDTQTDTQTRILSKLMELAATEGYYWSCSKIWWESKVKGEIGEIEFGEAKLEEVITGNGFFHSLQANAKYTKDPEKFYRTKFLIMLRSIFLEDVKLPEDVNAAFMEEAAKCLEDFNLDVVVNLYYRHNDVMLYERDLWEVPWRHVLSNCAIVEFLIEMIGQRGWELPSNHWDFTTITLCNLLTSIEMSKHHWGSTKISMLTRSVLRLFVAVHKFISNVRAECLKRQPSEHVADLPTEWKDVFAPNVNHSIFSILVHVLESSIVDPITSNRVHVLSSLISSMDHLDWHCLPPPHQATLPLQRMAGASSKALTQPIHHAYKYLAYCTLRMTAKPLVLDDAEKLASWSEQIANTDDEDRARPKLSLDHYYEDFTHLEDVVMAALSNVNLGEETCSMVVGSDSHSLTLGWLLLADVMANQFALTRGDLVHHYIQIYRDCLYAEPLLLTSLRLLPPEVFAFGVDNSSSSNPPAAYASMFVSTKEFDVYEPARSEDISALACRCVYTSVSGAACVGARGWWGAAQPRQARLLQRVVRAYVAPPLIREQMIEVQQRAGELEDTAVIIHTSTNEVECVYTVDDRPVELHITLSRDHPLVAPKVVAPDAGGPGGNTQWPALCLAYQNGTVINALKLWKQGVDAKMESFPQCYICYCRLHPSNGHLPRVTCRQCKNKYHNVCLRKWFLTSNKTNCPLCRHNF